MTVAYAAFFSALTIARHAAFDSGAFDLGFMDQAAWNTIRGHIMGVSIEPWTATTHLGYHFDPILIPISLTYLVYSNPNSLLIVQSVGLALGALPASWIARRRLGNNWAAVVFAAAYLLYPGLQAANVYDFHDFSLAAPLTLFCFYLIETRRYRLFALAVVLTMATKENVPLTTAMLGLYILVANRDLRPGLATFFGSIAWFLVGTYVVIPSFNSEGQGWLWNRYGGMGGTPLQIFGFLLENPYRLIEPAPGLSNLSYVAKLLFPLGFLSLLGPLELAVIGPGLATNILTVYEPMHMLETYHYSSALVPIVVVAAIHGAERALRWGEWVGNRLGNHGKLARLTLLTATCVGVLACSLVYQYYRGYTPISPSFDWPKVTEHHVVGEEIAASIPEDAGVSAQSNVYPHVSRRKTVHMFPYVGEADYIFLDVASQPNSIGFNDNFHKVIKDTLSRADFGVVIARDGYLLLKRGAPHRELPDEFYSFARAESPKPRYPIDLQFGDEARLIGFDVQTARDATANLTLYWQALAPIGRDLFFPIYFTDAEGHELGGTLYPEPANVWYPTSRWRVGETVKIQTINLPYAAGGRGFGLAVGVVDGSDPWDVGKRLRPTLRSAEWRTPAPTDGTLVQLVYFDNDRGLINPVFARRDLDSPASNSIDATIGDAARLVGYDLTPTVVAPGDTVRVTLHWRATGRFDRGYTVFVHLLDEQGKLVAQRDSPPRGGRAPTTLWLPGDAYSDEYDLALPTSLPPGEYKLTVGMYNPSDGKRLPVTGADGGGDAVAMLGTVQVK